MLKIIIDVSVIDNKTTIREEKRTEKEGNGDNRVDAFSKDDVLTVKLQKSAPTREGIKKIPVHIG